MKLGDLAQQLRNRRHRKRVYSSAAYWDSKAEALRGDAVSMWPNNHLNRHYHGELIALLEDVFPGMEGWNVLDVGSGTGRLARVMAARGAVVTGIDFSEKAVGLARQAGCGGNPSYRVQSVFDLDECGVYDVVFSWGCLAIAAVDRGQLLQALRRLRRALKPGGRALLLEPVHRGFLHRVLDLDVKEFLDVMEEAGFTVCRLRQLHFWPVRLLLAYVSWPAWVTTPLYHLGQWLMGLPGLSGLGDYKAVLAVAREG
jgi:2-polyprenyl-3-methyl-5-hydroxy-6-metoxy-1,4-benzoquinol methylase